MLNGFLSGERKRVTSKKLFKDPHQEVFSAYDETFNKAGVKVIGVRNYSAFTPSPINFFFFLPTVLHLSPIVHTHTHTHTQGVSLSAKT